MPNFSTRTAECKFYVKQFLTLYPGDHSVKECADYVREHASSLEVAGTGVMAGVMRTLITSEPSRFATLKRGLYRYLPSSSGTESVIQPPTLLEQAAQVLEEARDALARICTVKATELNDAELEALPKLVALSRELEQKAAQLRKASSS